MIKVLTLKNLKIITSIHTKLKEKKILWWNNRHHHMNNCQRKRKVHQQMVRDQKEGIINILHLIWILL